MRIVPAGSSVSTQSYTVVVVMWEVQIVERAPSVCFIAAGMDKMEVKNQQIQTEIVKTVEQHVQAGSTAQ